MISKGVSQLFIAATTFFILIHGPMYRLINGGARLIISFVVSQATPPNQQPSYTTAQDK